MAACKKLVTPSTMEITRYLDNDQPFTKQHQKENLCVNSRTVGAERVMNQSQISSSATFLHRVSPFSNSKPKKKKKMNMEESLIPRSEKEEKSERWLLTWAGFVEETKRVGYLAGPMVAVTISQYLLQVISTMMVGHLGELALSSCSIAISLAGVTDFSFLETSTAQYILQQYTATSGGLKLQNSIRNTYAMGKLKMVACEYETATKTVKNRYGSRSAESGGFVLWQMNSDMWYVELAVGGCKVHAGCNGKLVWRQ